MLTGGFLRRTLSWLLFAGLRLLGVRWLLIWLPRFWLARLRRIFAVFPSLFSVFVFVVGVFVARVFVARVFIFRLFIFRLFISGFLSLGSLPGESLSAGGLSLDGASASAGLGFESGLPS